MIDLFGTALSVIILAGILAFATVGALVHCLMIVVLRPLQR